MKTNISNKIIKNAMLNIRISKTDKDYYTQEAKKYGMNLSEFVLNILKYKKLNVVEGGGEIAHAIYDFNNALNHYKLSCDSVDSVRNAVSNFVRKMNNFLNEKGD